ncbi:MAG: DMT family transporter [Methanocorpusculum sp.]|nr:DMT family transporter [Candidatus Methanocorpusculum equi]
MIFSRIPKNAYVIAVAFALLAAVCTALKTPLAKLMMEQCDAVSTSAFIHLGMLIGMALIAVFGRKTPLMDRERHLQKKDTPLLILIILAGTVAALLVNFGLLSTTATTVVVLNNFTLVATALLAFFIFKEKISKRLWIAIVFITLGVMILSIGDITAFSLTPGALLIVGGTLCYGFANNIMKKVSNRNPVETSIVKAFGVTLLSFALMPFFGSTLPSLSTIVFMMVIGFLTSGLGFLFTLYAQRKLGAAKTGAISGIHPLLGIIASIIIFSEIPNLAFGAALLLIIPGLFFAITRNKDIAVEGEEVIPHVSDESSLLAGMSEITKRDSRNYITAFGFLAIAAFFVHMMIDTYMMSNAIIPLEPELIIFKPLIIMGLFLLVCGILLFILRKRAIAASTFVFTSAQIFGYALLPDNLIILGVFCAFSFVFAAILLLSKDRVKYVYAGISVAIGTVTLLWIIPTNGVLVPITIIVILLFTLLLIYITIACSSDKHSLPFTKYLIKDGEATIATGGQMLGYLFIAMYISMDLVCGLVKPEMLVSETMVPIHVYLILMLFLCGILLLFIGKMRFTPTLFIGIAFAFWLDNIGDGYLYYIAVFALLIIGVMAVLRKYSRLLPSPLTIFSSFSMMLSYLNYLGEVGLKSADIIISGACALLAIYLAVATFSEVKKLPLF